MNTHRKMAAMLAAAALIASTMAACATDGSAESDVTVDVGNGTINPRTAKKYAVMLQAGKTYSSSAAQGKIAEKVADELGIDVDVFYSNLDPATELQTFNTAITSGKYTGIAVHPVNNQLCKTAPQSAIKSDTIIAIFGAPLCGNPSGAGKELWTPGTVTYIGGQNGRGATVGLLDSAAEIASGPQKVLLVVGNEGNAAVTSFLDGWEDFSNKNSDWELVDTVYTDWTAPGAFSATQNALQGRKDVTVVVTPFVDISSGVVKAVEAQGLDDKIKIFEQSGGSKVSVDLLQEGKISGSLPLYPASQTRKALEEMVASAKGEEVPRYIGGDGDPNALSRVLTHDDLGDYTPQY